jgi:hypothetical protein
MAVTIIVEDGSIVPLANSYVSVADFQQFCEQRGVVLPTIVDLIGVLLVKAGDYLNSSDFCWRGFKVNAAQSMAWPRFEAIVDDVELLSTAIPAGIQQAQMQAAIALSAGIDLQPNLTNRDFVRKEEVGPLKVEYFDTLTLYPNNNRLTALNSLVKPFLHIECTNSGFSLKTLRA